PLAVPPPRRASFSLCYCRAAHPPLHSFPTRRSSDLAGNRRRGGGRRRTRRVARGSEHEEKAPAPRPSAPRPDGWVHRPPAPASQDRKSTRLNSSHVKISYAVFCLKKKQTDTTQRSAA